MALLMSAIADATQAWESLIRIQRESGMSARINPPVVRPPIMFGDDEA